MKEERNNMLKEIKTYSFGWNKEDGIQYIEIENEYDNFSKLDKGTIVSAGGFSYDKYIVCAETFEEACDLIIKWTKCN